MNTNKFPKNPFVDVSPKSFHSRNKKHVTEDFVSENFKMINWDVYRPFNDTGIDLIISKKICSKEYKHTKFDEPNVNTCKKCNSKTLRIYRFIQVKTRELIDNVLGYTLKSKDFRTDPRHIFLFYSDHTEDFISISVFDYLNFFKDSNISHFGTPTFNQGNEEVNSRKYDFKNDKWFYGTQSWEQFRNESGVNYFLNRDFDTKLEIYSNKIDILKKKLFYDFKMGRTFKFNEKQKEEIRKFIEVNIIQKKNKDFMRLTDNYINKMKSLNQNVRESANSYLREYGNLYERTKN